MSERQPPFVPRQVPRQPGGQPVAPAPAAPPPPAAPPAEAPTPAPAPPAVEAPALAPTPAPAAAAAATPTAPAGEPEVEQGPLRHRFDQARSQPAPSLDPAMHGQRSWRVRFDWGVDGLRAVAPDCRVVVLVDVLRFTTCVEVATSRDVAVLPYLSGGDVAGYAQRRGAVPAGRREDGQPSLSPVSMLDAKAGSRIVVPSPNGGTLAMEAANIGIPYVIAGCLRNASAVAEAAARAASGGGTIAVVAAGERWGGDRGPLRPAVEDLIGAGAVLSALDPGACSPEGRAAAGAYYEARTDVGTWLRSCASGVELLERGWGDDIDLAADLDVSSVVPVLRDFTFVPLADQEPPPGRV